MARPKLNPLDVNSMLHTAPNVKQPAREAVCVYCGEPMEAGYVARCIDTAACLLRMLGRTDAV